jgi:hypothetical protein
MSNDAMMFPSEALEAEFKSSFYKKMTDDQLTQLSSDNDIVKSSDDFQNVFFNAADQYLDEEFRKRLINPEKWDLQTRKELDTWATAKGTTVDSLVDLYNSSASANFKEVSISQLLELGLGSQGWSEEQRKKANLQIFVGSDKHWDSSTGENKLTENSLSKIHQALTNPSEVEGSVRIMRGDEKIYHVQDREISENQLFQQKMQVEQQAALPVETAQTSPRTESALHSWDDVRNLIAVKQQNPDIAENAIFQLMAYQATQINQLQQKLEAMEKIKPLDHRIGALIENINKTAAQALNTVKERSQSFPQDIKQFFGEKANQIQESALAKVQNLKKGIVDGVTHLQETVVSHAIAVKDAVESRVADALGHALYKTNHWLANRYGQDNGTGVKVYDKGHQYTFTASGLSASIFDKAGRELVKNGHFTEHASQQDISKLSQLPKDVQQASQALAEQQQQKAGVGMKH